MKYIESLKARAEGKGKGPGKAKKNGKGKGATPYAQHQPQQYQQYQPYPQPFYPPPPQYPQHPQYPPPPYGAMVPPAPSTGGAGTSRFPASNGQPNQGLPPGTVTKGNTIHGASACADFQKGRCLFGKDCKHLH